MRVVSVSVAAALWVVMEGIIFTLPVTNMSSLEKDVNLYEYHYEERSIYPFILRLLRVDSRTVNRVLCEIEHSVMEEGFTKISEEHLRHRLRMS